jgi:hypothetical protein
MKLPLLQREFDIINKLCGSTIHASLTNTIKLSTMTLVLWIHLVTNHIRPQDLNAVAKLAQGCAVTDQLSHSLPVTCTRYVMTSHDRDRYGFV